MHPILKGVVARVASLVPAAIASLLASRLILEHYDIEVFNTYVLVFSTMVLIPLNDLGAGAALTSAVAADGAEDPHTTRVALTAARVLAVSGLGLGCVALVLSAFGFWGDVLGGGAFATGTFGVAIAAYGLSFVPGLGQSALLGANKNHLTIAVQGFLAPAMCVGAALSVGFDLDPRWVVVVPGLAVLLISLVNAWLSARVTRLRLLPLLPKLPFRRAHPGATNRGIAGPALIISLTAPFTLQSDRLVLSHFGTSQDVANYSVAVQIFAPLLALIPAAARPLWPMFTKARATGTQPVSITKVIAAFVTIAAIGGALLVAVAGPLAKVIGGDQIDLGVALPIAMAGGTVVQAVAVPLSMALMYPAGLRLIASLSLICMPVNIVLSIIVTPHLGAPGPLYVGIGIGFFLQTVPAVVHLRRHAVGSSGEQSSMAPVPAPGESALLVDGALSVVGGASDLAAAVRVPGGQVGADEQAVGPPHPLVDAVDVGGEEGPEHEP
jgi:O-antigen/teichoic acid export membrane protein